MFLPNLHHYNLTDLSCTGLDDSLSYLRQLDMTMPWREIRQLLCFRVKCGQLRESKRGGGLILHILPPSLSSSDGRQAASRPLSGPLVLAKFGRTLSSVSLYPFLPSLSWSPLPEKKAKSSRDARSTQTNLFHPSCTHNNDIILKLFLCQVQRNQWQTCVVFISGRRRSSARWR